MALRKVAEIKIGGEQVDVLADIETAKRQIRGFKNLGISTAVYRAANKSASKARTLMIRLAADKYAFKVGTIRPLIYVSPKATLTRHTVAITGRGARIPMIKTKGTPRQAVRGASFNSGSGKRVHPHTFIATMPSGHKGIYVRSNSSSRRVNRISKATGKGYQSELPIRELTQPSPAHMVTNKDLAEQVFKAFTIDYPVQLRRQLDYAVKRSRGLL